MIFRKKAEPLLRSSVDMEDAHATVLQLDEHRWSQWAYFGVFDGHAGFRTAVKAADKLHPRLLSSLNTFVQESSGNVKASTSITSSQLDYPKFEMTIKDAYFKFDHEWREENRNNNPGRRRTIRKILSQTCSSHSRRQEWFNGDFVFN